MEEIMSQPGSAALNCYLCVNQDKALTRLNVISASLCFTAWRTVKTETAEGSLDGPAGHRPETEPLVPYVDQGPWFWFCAPVALSLHPAVFVSWPLDPAFLRVGCPPALGGGLWMAMRTPAPLHPPVALLAATSAHPPYSTNLCELSDAAALMSFVSSAGMFPAALWLPLSWKPSARFSFYFNSSSLPSSSLGED